MGKCTCWWNICGNNFGFIDVILSFINKTLIVRFLWLSASDLTKYKSIITTEAWLHLESEAHNYIKY